MTAAPGLRIEVQEHPDHLRFDVKGRYTLRSFLDLVGRVAREARGRARTSVLVDVTAVETERAPSTVDRFDLAVHCTEHLRDVRRLAVVKPERHVNWMFEDAAVNRGLNVLVVPESRAEAARRWRAGGPRPQRLAA